MSYSLWVFVNSFKITAVNDLRNVTQWLRHRSLVIKKIIHNYVHHNNRGHMAHFMVWIPGKSANLREKRFFLTAPPSYSSFFFFSSLITKLVRSYFVIQVVPLFFKTGFAVFQLTYLSPYLWSKPALVTVVLFKQLPMRVFPFLTLTKVHLREVTPTWGPSH